MNVFQVKNVISKTDCVDYVYSGLFCSEPIMSKDSKGEIIDNYVVFSRTDDGSLISAPQCVFGIYTELEKSAYINDLVSKEFQEHTYQEKFADDDTMQKARELYLELFPKVRDMYRMKKNVDMQTVLSYIESLKIISGDTLFGFYEKLFPSFFDWTKSYI